MSAAIISMPVIGKPFEKGNPGRKPGPNKKTKQLKEAIASFCEDNFDQVQEDYQTLTPKERLQFFAALVQYAVPKKSTIEVEPMKPVNERLLSMSFEQLEEIEAKAKPLEIGN